MFRLTPLRFKILFNCYPPLWANRIRVLHVSEDFQQVDVRLRFSVFNRNMNSSLFGGSIFIAADAFYPIMYRSAMGYRKIACQGWLKKAEIDYLKPAKSDLLYAFRLTDEDMLTAELALRDVGRYQQWHTVEAIDEHGTVCARVRLLSCLVLEKK